MSISEAFTRDNDDHIFAGHIIQGHIEIEQHVRFAICGREGITKSIFMHNKSMLIAEAGDLVGIRVEFNVDGDDKQLIAVENESEYQRNRRLRIFHKRMRGEILYAMDANAMVSVPRVVKQFTAKIHVLRCKCIRRGSKPIIYIKNNKCACKLVDIKWVVRSDDNNNVSEKILFPSEIRTGDEAEIVMEPSKPFVVCSFDECEALSRIIAVNSNMFLFYGHAISVEVQDCK